MNNHVVHENYYLMFSNHSGERFVHILLESGRSVSLSKEHNEWFENSSWHYERCLPLISSLDLDIRKSSSHVKLGEV